MQTLLKQLRFELQRFNVLSGDIETLFIGGGTPSTIHPKLYEPIFKEIYPLLASNAEITAEANPNSATQTWLEGMKKLGVNRVSFGVQSFQADKLKALNRAHSPQDAITAINRAYQLGFEHLSLDLIYNYQGDTKELLLEDIKQSFKLPIDHISAYELTIEAKTKFFHTPKCRQENDSLAFFIADEIKKRGFEHYEISNFGNYQSRHNRGYWQLKDYIGIGAGAVGFRKNTRYYPTKDIKHYIKNPTYITKESISPDELLIEQLFLGLRSTIGIRSDILTTKMQQRCDLLVKEKKLTKEHNIYKNSDFFLADEIALFILN